MSKQTLSQILLQWYERHGRDLPWRHKFGPHPDPYVILVSEFMLQQTGVKTVIPYFQRFMQRFPDLEALAQASEDEINLSWQGLGYYSRARSLLSAARQIMNNGGKFPESKEEILKLPGVGPYTAASIAALAFNQPETVVDGNVIRVICRLYHLTQPADAISGHIRQLAETLTDKQRPADYASAIMDLGATICTPKKPLCLCCPWQAHCLSCNAPDLEDIPCRRQIAKQLRCGRVYFITNDAGQIFIRKRREKGLLSGLYEFPWNEDADPWPQAEDSGLEVSHVFTHIKLKLRLFYLTGPIPDSDGFFIAPEDLSDYPLSTLMRKIYHLACAAKP